VKQVTARTKMDEGNDTILGADLHNEPHNSATWGDGGPTDWARAATEAGNAVLDINPDWLVVVEGISNYDGDNYWWGGNLQGVADHPIELDVDNRLVYSPHDYPASVFEQSWFFDGSDLTEVFRENWGYIYEEGIAPVLIGELMRSRPIWPEISTRMALSILPMMQLVLVSPGGHGTRTLAIPVVFWKTIGRPRARMRWKRWKNCCQRPGTHT